MDEKETVIESLEARSKFYRMLASLYFRPLTQEQIDALAEIDWEAYANVNEEFATGVHHITRQLTHRHSGTRELLAADFTGSFGGNLTYKNQGANPYESIFTSGEFMHGTYMDVYKAYKAENIKRREGFDYPEDHISFMFQFEAMMGDRAIEAIKEGNNEEAKKNLSTAIEFKTDHIDSWFDQLIEAAEKLLHERFYRGLLHMTKGFLEMDSEETSDIIASL